MPQGSPGRQALSPRVIQQYGSHLSPRSRDSRLEAAINGTMDYLANEGLSVPGLFQSKAPAASVHKTMVAVFSGQDPDFVALNDAPLATSILDECLIRMSEPVFPWKLVDPLSEVLRVNTEPPERQHIRTQAIVLDAVRRNSVSPVFLNLLGLLNLVVQHAGENGCDLEVAAGAFAHRMLENFGASMQPDSQQWRLSISKATSVLSHLIDKVYVMFPPQNEAAADDANMHKPEDPSQPSSTVAAQPSQLSDDGGRHDDEVRLVPAEYDAGREHDPGADRGRACNQRVVHPLE